jgi:predicted phosphodiesterase
MAIKVVTISDTHTYHKSVVLPPGDILIHAGDFTFRGYEQEVRAFGNWLRMQDQFQHKVVIAGNHDRSFEDDPENARKWLLGDDPDTKGVVYLQDSEAALDVRGEKFRVYGSPWQPFFCNWAFNLYSDELEEKWDLIPEGLDCLITHGPPYKILDQTDAGEHVGCRELRTAIERTKPVMSVHGHIHEGFGVEQFKSTLVVNASSCTSAYKASNKPLVFEYENGTVRQA